MQLIRVLALFFAATLPGFAQTTGNAGAGLPKDPRGILAAAAPFYDFSSPELKPWHLKATYQLYDEKGKPSEQGVYEYWWASPKVYRSTWTRQNATHSDWHTADGKHAYLATGERLGLFEYKLRNELMSPLPRIGDLDASKFRLERQSVSSGGVKFPCVMVIPVLPLHPQMQTEPLGIFPTYCFDPKLPVLRTSYSFGTLTTEFNNVVEVQKKYLPREILYFDGKREILSATVDGVTPLTPSDPAFTPAETATLANVDRVEISAGVAQGMLLKKLPPDYPLDAKNASFSGTVTLEAIIGTDGSVRDLQVLASPMPSLADSALEAVSHWEYKPYMLNGEPVEVKTTVDVFYSFTR
jgi:TonB family protein